MNFDIKVALAKKSDAGEVMTLYKSLIGTFGCTWNEYYPDIEGVNMNIDENSLYIIRNEKGELIAAAGCAVEEEQIELECWNKNIKNPCGLFRVAVRHDFQGNGIGEILVRYIMKDAAKRGYDGILLLVSPTNPAAYRLYCKCGFRKCGECEMYDMQWYCCELILTEQLTE